LALDYFPSFQLQIRNHSSSFLNLRKAFQFRRDYYLGLKRTQETQKSQRPLVPKPPFLTFRPIKRFLPKFLLEGIPPLG